MWPDFLAEIWVGWELGRRFSHLNWEGRSALKQPNLNDSETLSVACRERGVSRGVPIEGSSSLAGIEPDGQEIAIETCDS